jgi:hypothetical protein
MSFITDRLLFSICDDKEQQHGCHLIENINKAFEYNSKGWGVFHTVNKFKGKSRTSRDCVKVLSWAVDIDPPHDSYENKKKILDRINRGPKPTTVVDSGRGYHVYFDADDSAKVENYSEIVSRLIEYYGGDIKAKDPARLLRTPGFLHQKDKLNPRPVILLKDYWNNYSRFSEEEMLILFPKNTFERTERYEKSELKRVLSFQKDGSLFEKIYSMDCLDGLKRLSGTAAVNMEGYSFKEQRNGSYNIFVNNKSTSCWVDKNKRIGSGDRGGPTLWQWINWYHRDHKKTYQFIKDNFKELFI